MKYCSWCGQKRIGKNGEPHVCTATQYQAADTHLRNQILAGQANGFHLGEYRPKDVECYSTTSWLERFFLKFVPESENGTKKLFGSSYKRFSTWMRKD